MSTSNQRFFATIICFSPFLGEFKQEPPRCFGPSTELFPKLFSLRLNAVVRSVTLWRFDQTYDLLGMMPTLRTSITDFSTVSILSILYTFFFFRIKRGKVSVLFYYHSYSIFAYNLFGNLSHNYRIIEVVSHIVYSHLNSPHHHSLLSSPIQF